MEFPITEIKLSEAERLPITIMFYETAHVQSLFEAASQIVAVLDAEGSHGAVFETVSLIMNVANTELSQRAKR